MMSVPSARRAWIVWPMAALGYFLMAAAATWPVVLKFGAEIPGELTDPLEHLWIMRWLRSCLLAGRNPLFCPEIQAPIGVPLGYFPPLHLQTALYILGRLVTENDVAIFDAIWFLGFVATGLAAFGLARWALDAECPVGVAWVAGLGVMLCGPMLMHAHGHLETMQLGVVPPFLIAWLRFVDQPGWRRLAGAVGLYLLVTAAAPYYAVLAIFPAAWYLGYRVLVADRGERWPAVRERAPWLVGFGLIVLPGVAVLFGAQIWAALHGWPMTRSKREFDLLGAPVWSSLVPSPRHLLGQTLVPNLFVGGLRGRMPEVSSYLGMVALGLISLAIGRRVEFPRRGFWWSVLGLLIVLSWGSRQEVFGAHPSLPAGWLYGVFPPFHLIRVPARFNLFAAAVAVVPVAAGLRSILVRRSVVVRGLLVCIVAGLTLADLAMVPFPSAAIPEPPPSYDVILRTQPDATILDAPLFDSSRGQTYSALWAYWGQLFGLRTSAGYPGLTNTRFDAEIVAPSAFAADRLRSLSGPQAFGVDGLLDPRDRAWLELTAHGFDRVAVHFDLDMLARYPDWFDQLPDPVGKVARNFSHPPFFSGGFLQAPKTMILAWSQLAPPARLAWMSDRGWRPVLVPRGEVVTRYAALPEARIEIYQPAAGPVRLRLEGVEAFARPRVVRLIEDERELTRWRIEPGAMRTIESEPIALAGGRHTWNLIADGADRPTRSADRLDEAATPFSWRLAGVRMVADRPVGSVSKD